MSLRADRVVLAVVSFAAPIFACTSPVNDDVVINGRPETPSFGSSDASAVAPDAEAGAGLCPSNECPADRVSCPNNPFPCGVDLASDDNNCGACGVRCPNDQEYMIRFWGITRCVGGTCRLTCSIGSADCNGLLDDGCEAAELDYNDENCGACGVKCKDPYVCIQGSCVCRGKTCPCPSGQTRCPPHQLCTDLKKDNDNCDACGNACPPSVEPPFPPEWNMGRSCTAGKCNQPRCMDGYADCNGDMFQPSGNGCETNTQSDVNDCGACGNVCAPGEVCAEGRCVCSCGLACYTTIDTDTENCGTCGFVCPTLRPNELGHGHAVCRQGVCGYVCDARWSDCDNDIANGCETDLSADPMNCGTCGARCDGMEGQACVDGRCLMKECVSTK